MTNDLHSFLRARRSIRRFRPDPVPVELVDRIIETATYAPSAHNDQPWRFVVVTAPADKTRLAEAITGRFRFDMDADGAPTAAITDRVARTLRRTNEAPVIIILCRDVTQVNPQPDEVRRAAESTMAVQSLAAAGLQLLLAAHAEGLGGVWICWPLFAPQETQKALGIPSDWQPQGMIFLGYPAEQPEASARKPFQEIVRHV